MPKSNTTEIHNLKELEFSIFCIETIAERLGIHAEIVYDALTSQTNLLINYIIQEYEILHTQSKDYIVSDILEAMREEGIQI